MDPCYTGAMASDDPAAVGDEEKDRRLEEVLSWAVDHMADQTNFGTPLVIVGDPEVLAADLSVLAAPIGEELWRLVSLPSGNAVAVGGGEGDGPWLLVMRSSDGPLTQAIIQPDIWTDAASTQTVGELVLPSGRLVIGDPESVQSWGPAVAPDGDLDVQPKTGWDEPSPTYLGPVVVVRLHPGARCRIEVARTRDGHLHAVTIAFPSPDWLPADTQP